MAQANIDASRRVIEEAFGEGRLELLDELCAENFVDHDPIMGDQHVDAVKQTIAGYCAAFPDLSFTIDDIMACGDKVVVRWTGQGTFQNESAPLHRNQARAGGSVPRAKRQRCPAGGSRDVGDYSLSAASPLSGVTGRLPGAR